MVIPRGSRAGRHANLPAFLSLASGARREKVATSVPKLALLREHEKNQEGHEGNFQEQRVQGAGARKISVRTIRVPSAPSPRMTRPAPAQSAKPALDSPDFAFHGNRQPAAEHCYISASSRRNPRSSSIARSRRRPAPRSRSAPWPSRQCSRQPESFQEFHRWIQKVGQQNRKQQRDHHARGVIERTAE